MRGAELQPTPEQEDLLRATIERVNRACDEVAKAAFAAGVRAGAVGRDALAPFVAEQVQRYALASPYPSVVAQRVADALAESPDRPPRFRPRQSIVLAPRSVTWSANDRVGIPTWKGKRTVRVRLDPRAGPVPLRHPLTGQPVALTDRNGKLYLDPLERDDE